MGNQAGITITAAVAMSAWTAAQQVKPSAAFQTPIIFPLLWMAKRLTQHHRIGTPPLPFMMPLSTTLKSIAGAKDNLQTTDSDSAERLVEWLNELEGASLSSVKIDANSQGLRGLYATKDIRSREVLVEIPYEAALLVGDSLSELIFDDFDNVTGSDAWSHDDLDDVYQGLNFLQAFMNDYDYTAYVNSLPEAPSSGDDAGLTPDFWSRETILRLEVPSYINQILERKQIVQEVAKENNVNEKDLRWATWMMRSRRFTTWNMVNDPDSDEDDNLFGVFPMRRKPIEQVQGFLLPLIDMANHAQDPNAVLKISVNRWTREFDDTSTFALRALRPIKKGEEVTISYGDGDRTSLDLLDKYGFFIEGNEADQTIDWEDLKPEFTTSLEEDEAELASLEEDSREIITPVLTKTTDKLKTIVSKIQAVDDISFSSQIDDLLLVGTGMRQKMGIKIYAVAMYGSPALLQAASSSSSSNELRNAARTFDDTSPRTTFVLQMILQADSASTIAEAIADSVKLRYGGPIADVQYLESLIEEGVKASGPSTKGSILKFDCSEDGVSVSVNRVAQGTAKFKGLGSAVVDVFMDSDTVSPSLVENCIVRGNNEEETLAIEGATSANMADGKDIGSRRTMLSLRILMKRLSDWTPKSTSQPIASETVDNGDNMEPKEDPLEQTVSDTDDNVIEPEPEEDDIKEADTEVLMSSPNDEVEATASAEDTESPGPEPIPASDGENTPVSSLVEEAEDVIEEEVDTTTTSLPPNDRVAIESSTAFDSNSIEERIRQLEAEIQAEIARVQSSTGQEPGNIPIVTQNVAVPAPNSSNDASLQDKAEISPVVSEEEARLKLEAEGKQNAANEAAEKAAAEARQKLEAIESKMKPLKDKATSVTFDPKLDNGLYLIGVGVRKKAIINVYSVALYSSSSTLEALSQFPRGKQKKEARDALRNAARTFGPSSTTTSLVLEMVFKADAQTIAGAIAEGVKPRYSGSPSDVKLLENLIMEGVKNKGGQATKGTILRFDCTAEGVTVSVDGNEQGTASLNGLGSAFVDVFTDDKAVSPPLVESCLNTWCGNEI
eukprot:CAMPEP_0183707122 /NCGR_PEP_ID=MMETSP0737-20130205/3770_1 /TAXON_ID=385413 /ORGANISM="Thalassiosira miniscula, Strain CCMP1093" /LENGTH=1065 /DNA_ID=CAMNT_0025934703 /DNA_START=20 /DNA_END=3217 /DNA_ORIENTATION=+